MLGANGHCLKNDTLSNMPSGENVAVRSGIPSIDMGLNKGGFLRGSISFFVADDLFHSSALLARFVANANAAGYDSAFLLPFSVVISENTKQIMKSLPFEALRVRDDLLIQTIELLISKGFEFISVLLPESDAWLSDYFVFQHFIKKLFRSNTALLMLGDSSQLLDGSRIKRQYRSIVSVCGIRCRVHEDDISESFVLDFKRSGLWQEHFQVSLPRGLL